MSMAPTMALTTETGKSASRSASSSISSIASTANSTFSSVTAISCCRTSPCVSSRCLSFGWRGDQLPQSGRKSRGKVFNAFAIADGCIVEQIDNFWGEPSPMLHRAVSGDLDLVCFVRCALHDLTQQFIYAVLVHSFFSLNLKCSECCKNVKNSLLKRITALHGSKVPNLALMQ